MNLEDLYAIYCKNPSVQTDTRKLAPGDIFFALKGPNFNGNKFASKALESGAVCVVTDEDTGIIDSRIFQVADSLQALQQLASIHREHFKIPFIAITGSNGKTTTKELIHAVLSSHFKTYTTTGNLNNHIGVPLTLLRIKSDAEMAVIEMGANHLHEIASYCTYAKPDFGLITNIGKAHLEGFGGAENVKKGKGELFDYLKAHEGTVFVNTDDPQVNSLGATLDKKVFYGSNQSVMTGKLLQSDPYLNVQLYNPSTQVQTQLVGSYNLPNVLAAVTVGRHFHVPEEKIKQAIEQYAPSNSRSQMMVKDGCHIIMDAYNANPGSMKAAIVNFASMAADNKILILGDMKELGADSRTEHEAIVKLIRSYEWADVILTGPEFAKISHPFHQFNNSAEAAAWVNNHPLKNAYILVKGSRSMQMEKVFEK